MEEEKFEFDNTNKNVPKIDDYWWKREKLAGIISTYLDLIVSEIDNYSDILKLPEETMSNFFLKALYNNSESVEERCKIIADALKDIGLISPELLAKICLLFDDQEISFKEINEIIENLSKLTKVIYRLADEYRREHGIVENFVEPTRGKGQRKL